MQRTICYGGVYWDITRGISLGCPLSPLMAALYLKPLDDRMEALDLFYARFMDDWIIVAPTRWKLRKAIRLVNRILNDLRVEQHPYKTLIGRGDRGFEFLGYLLTPAGLEAATETVKRCAERIIRLYEQGADINRIGDYVRRWGRWLQGGLDQVVIMQAVLTRLQDRLNKGLKPRPRQHAAAGDSPFNVQNASTPSFQEPRRGGMFEAR